MVKDLNAPVTRWKSMKIGEVRKPFIKIRPEDNVVSQMITILRVKKQLNVP